MVLQGRDAERAALAALLDGARAGRSGALVITGAAGLGKTALLADAAGRAGELRVLHAAGVEAEAALPFAALHQLLLPVLDLVGLVPEPQAAALRRALGLAAGRAAEPLLVGAGLLGVLAEAAPALVLVDDLQWVDAASAAAIAFAARRLEAEGVALLMATRDDAGPTGLPGRPLAPLERAAAAAVLDGAGLAPAVREALLDAAAGNPLALVELPAGLAPEQRTGRAPLDGLPVPARLAAGFEARLAPLSPDARGLLVLAAADATGDAGAVLAATRTLSPAAALAEAEETGLLRLRAGRLVWRHPLVRATVARAAGDAALRAAHAALAQVSPPDAAAWHRAAAALGPDAEVAAALAGAAEHAAARGAHAAAAEAWARAAELTPDAEVRAARFVGAAGAAWTAGHAERAEALLEAAGPPPDPALRAEADRIRGSVALHRGRPAEARLLLQEAARTLAPHDPAAALRLGVGAMEAASLAGEPAPPDVPADGAAGDHGRFLVDMVAGVRALFTGRQAAAVETLRRVVASGAELTDPQLVVWAGAAAFFAGDEQAAVALHERAATLARAEGHAVVLPFALTYLATAHAAAGRLAVAEADLREALRLAAEAGLANTEVQTQATLAGVLALRGDAASRELADSARAAAAARGLVLAEGSATLALAELELASGDPDAAFERLVALVHGPGAHPAHRTGPVPLLVETAARAGRADEARDAAQAFAAWAETWGTGWATPLAARSLALVTADERRADELLHTALRLHDGHQRPLDRARTALLLGERLRRARHKAEARAPLRVAFEDFARAGAQPWAERARDELRAAGGGAPPRRGRPLDRLTPQERQVARLVAEGATNRDVATALFLSPRTVEYHLHKVFRKLRVHRRAELAALLLGEEAR